MSSLILLVMIWKSVSQPHCNTEIKSSKIGLCTLIFRQNISLSNTPEYNSALSRKQAVTDKLKNKLPMEGSLVLVLEKLAGNKTRSFVGPKKQMQFSSSLLFHS